MMIWVSHLVDASSMCHMIVPWVHMKTLFLGLHFKIKLLSMYSMAIDYLGNLKT